MSTRVTYDGSYLKTISGILKICCLIYCFLGFICIVCSSVALHNFRAGCYFTIVLLEFSVTLLLLMGHLFHLWDHKFHNFTVIKWEFHIHVVFAFASFIAAITVISLNVVAYTIATFFALLTFGFYSIDAFFGYRLYRQRDAQIQTEPQLP